MDMMTANGAILIIEEKTAGGNMEVCDVARQHIRRLIKGIRKGIKTEKTASSGMIILSQDAVL